MKPLLLTIENFSCIASGTIDFSKFNSSLIIGMKSNNDMFSNGVGKTSIFKAIEYVLFNSSSTALEKIIRDDCKAAKIRFDFELDNKFYKIIRTRTRTVSDVSFFVSDVYPTENWKDLSGRRITDTEKETKSLIKMNYDTFKTIIHFIQWDMSGIATATPAERKKILKNSLDLSIYLKLEKLAKDKFSNIQKIIAIKKGILESIIDPDSEIKTSQSKIETEKLSLILLEEKYKELEFIKTPLEESKTILIKEISKLESSYSAVSSKKNFIESSINSSKAIIEKNKLFSKELKEKANLIIAEMQQLKLQLAELQKSIIDTSEINKELSEHKKELSKLEVLNKTIEYKVKELSVPLPGEEVCSKCKQKITDEYREDHKKEIEEAIATYKNSILENKVKLLELEKNINEKNKIIEEQVKLNNKNTLLLTSIEYKNKDIKDKKEQYTKSIETIKENEITLTEKLNQLNDVNFELEKFDVNYIERLKEDLKTISLHLNQSNLDIKYNQEQMSKVKSNIMFFESQIKQAEANKLKIQLLISEIKELEDEAFILPEVIQAFSSTGIPNLIIQSILDDLQTESNNALRELKPEIQLQFIVEKDNKENSDTLDIVYSINGRERLFEQLSGAQKLCASFSLKLGLSSLLQKIMGINVKFLLLDEVDDSLDKASIDSFSEIIKVLESKYKILVITHNDRLKEKFSNYILVEQDNNMVSKIIS